MSLIKKLWNWFWPRLHREPKPFVYVALGDSTVEGTGASHHSRSYAHLVYVDLARYYDHASYYNFGKQGARIKDVLSKQLEETCAVMPDLVTISVGANDVLHNTNLRAFRRTFEQVLQTLNEQTRALVVVTTIPDFSFTKRIPGAAKPAVRLRIRQYNHVIREVAAAAGATVVDTFRESALIAKRFPEAVSNDNFHPSDFGYIFWANSLLTSIHEKLHPQRHRWLFG